MLATLLYLATGLVSGFIAGLLGVGGGLIMVPLLAFGFAAQHLSGTHQLHMALATSLGVIVFTSLSSLRAHHGHGAVNWTIVRRITPGILAGTFAGTWLAARLAILPLKLCFVVFLFYAATQLLLDIRPKPHRQLPGAPVMFGAGGVIGAVSALVGIGGGTLSVPFMSWCNVHLHEAIGTSAAIGFPIAVAGSLGYFVNGLHTPGLPAWCAGFIYLPALLPVAVASVFTAPLGARLAHAVPVQNLKRIFAVLLYAIGIRMLITLR